MDTNMRAEARNQTLIGVAGAAVSDVATRSERCTAEASHGHVITISTSPGRLGIDKSTAIQHSKLSTDKYF